MSWGNDTEITDEGVRIRLLGFPKTIPFVDIQSVKKAPYWKAAFCNVGSSKTVLGLWNMPLEGGVLVETQNFWWVARPKNQDEFVKLVSSHLTNSN
jgi:hypothetical protein